MGTPDDEAAEEDDEAAEEEDEAAEEDDEDDADEPEEDADELEDDDDELEDDDDDDPHGGVSGSGSAVVSSRQPAKIVLMAMIGTMRATIRGFMGPLVQDGCVEPQKIP